MKPVPLPAPFSPIDASDFDRATMRRIVLSMAFLAGSTITNRSTTTTSSPSLLLCVAQLLPEDSVNSDFYCGYDWEEANLYCEHPCPSGLDADCPPLPNGLERRCIASAGCFYRFRSVNSTFVLSFLFDGNEHASSSGYAATASPATATADGNEAAPGGGGGSRTLPPTKIPARRRRR